jgi:hypothetical protein
MFFGNARSTCWNASCSCNISCREYSRASRTSLDGPPRNPPPFPGTCRCLLPLLKRKVWAKKSLCARITRMLCHFSRLSALPIFSILLLLSSASTDTLCAQSTAVRLPPSARLPPTKVDRPGFPPIPKFKDISSRRPDGLSHFQRRKTLHHRIHERRRRPLRLR